MGTFNIGQSIYILSNKNQTIIPAIVHSRHIEETVGIDNQVGQIISYKIKLGPPGKVQILDLNRLDGDVFSSLEEIRSSLLERLTDFVNSLIRTTEDKAAQWYGIQKQSIGGDNSPNNSIKLDPDQVMNAIENQVPIQNTINPSNLILDQSNLSPDEQIGTITPDGIIRPSR